MRRSACPLLGRLLVGLSIVLAPDLAAKATAAPGEPGHANHVQVGWCSKAITVAAAPYAVAIVKGWYARAGVTVELVPAGTSSECAGQIASGRLAFALPSVESAAVLRMQGARPRYFYTAYQSNIYGLAVPATSDVQSVADLKGKRIGVAATGSASAVIARHLVREAGLEPDRDVSFVVASDPAQSANLIGSGAVDALSHFDAHYAVVERAGVSLRRLPHPSIENFPSSGLLALEETLSARREDAIALARGYAMGTIYATANPAGAIRALWSVWPATRPADRDEATALQDGVAILMARASAWQLDRVGARLWGEHVEQHYQDYIEWLLAHGFISEKVAARDLLSNDLLKDINAFDAAAVRTEALKDRP